jgi:pimeloyl-ACP methyl ester carboxylesterase
VGERRDRVPACRARSHGDPFDLLGHGRSDKPLHASEHRLEYAGEQVVALLDHLGLDQAVIGGMSLGANVSLEVAATAPERVAGLVCEMPVLERGTIGVMLTLFPLLLALRFASRPMNAIFRLAGRVPRSGHEALNAVLDTGGDARAMAAVMHGYTAGPVCPPASERVRITAPTLIIGHGRDWIHPLNDAEALFAELPNAELVKANHFFELRARPARLMAEIVAFVDRVYAEAARATG